MRVADVSKATITSGKSHDADGIQHDTDPLKFFTENKHLVVGDNKMSYTTVRLEAMKLLDFPEHVDLVISWYRDAWGHVRPTEPQYCANLIKTRLSLGELPIAYVVFNPKNPGVPVATFALTKDINGIGNSNLILLHSVYVARDYRNNGIGTEVIKIAEKIAREQFGIQILQLFITNLDLEKWYKNLGWEKKETTSLKTVTGEVRAVVFTKHLAASKLSKL